MAEAPIPLDSFAASLPTSFLACRELGHVWRPFTVSWDADAHAYDRQLKCSRCKTTRKQLLDSHGHVLTNNYKHAPNYLAKGVEVIRGGGRDVFRLEAVTRFLDDHAEGK
jgi:hypothetical protein